MDFLRSVRTELDAKTDFSITDRLSELVDFCRDGLCILNGVPTGRGEKPEEHSSVDSRNEDEECKEL
jgi:hypothetical protein